MFYLNKTYFIFGKDEVGGSNPPSSSTKNPVVSMATGICYFLAFAYLLVTRQ